MKMISKWLVYTDTVILSSKFAVYKINIFKYHVLFAS